MIVGLKAFEFADESQSMHVLKKHDKNRHHDEAPLPSVAGLFGLAPAVKRICMISGCGGTSATNSKNGRKHPGQEIRSNRSRTRVLSSQNALFWLI